MAFINLKSEVPAIAQLFNEAGIEYAVCGGIAMALHGFVRATKIIDILVREEDLAQIQGIVETVGFSIPGGIIPFSAGTPDERRMFRISKVIHETLIPLDLMLVAPSLEGVWQDRVSAEVEGQTVVVVSREGLIEMKRSAGRRLDLADIERLEAEYEKDEDHPSA